MTQFSITITGTAKTLAEILGFASQYPADVIATAFPGAATAPAPLPLAAADDDDNGPTNANAPGVDANGMPWDERIHAKTKVINADGTWRTRRGVSKDVLAAVEAELRSGVATPPVALAPVPLAAPTMVAPPPMPVPAPVAAPAPGPAPVTAMPMPPAAPVADPAPAPVAAPSAAPQPGMDAGTLMREISARTQRVNPATGAPMIDPAYLADLTARVGAACQVQLVTFTDIMSHEHIIDYVASVIAHDGRW